jgi:hypothetical protein
MDPGAINHVLPLILSAMSSRATFVRVEVPPHTPIMTNYVNRDRCSWWATVTVFVDHRVDDHPPVRTRASRCADQWRTE